MCGWLFFIVQQTYYAKVGFKMLILDINKISKNFGYGTLFENLSFSLKEGERISIVGANGCGKSTILKMIVGFEKIDKGNINIKNGSKIAYLDQAASDEKDDRVVEDIIRDAFTDLLKMQKELNEIYDKLETKQSQVDTDRLISRSSSLQEEFQNRGGYEIDTEIDIVCNGLEISKNMRLQNYESLSGGEKTIIHLAKALLQKPDLFLLDEPTNHLDIRRIEWLEKCIKNFKGSTIIISHDRRFLDTMSHKILEIDNGEGTIYHTNYTGYLNEKERRYEKLMANWEEQQTYFKRLEDEAKRMAQAGMATNSHAMTRKAAVLFGRIEREKEKFAIKRPEKKRKIKMNFEEGKKSGKRALEVKDLTITTPEQTIVYCANFYVLAGEKVALIGDNGSGKSSIIKAILGEQELLQTGKINISPSSQIGYLPQTISFDDDKLKLLEYFQKEVSVGEEKARSILSRFLFDKEDVSKRVGNLSGGERIRVRLASLLQQQINTLIFDEPTNHIDIPTKESMEQAIEDFDGTLLFISHDRFFINKFADRIIEIENGITKEYLGNYDFYVEKKDKYAH